MLHVCVKCLWGSDTSEENCHSSIPELLCLNLARSYIHLSACLSLPYSLTNQKCEYGEPSTPTGRGGSTKLSAENVG